MLATALGFALVEWLLPYVSAFFESNARLLWWKEPRLLGCVAFGVIALAVIVGAYPGFVLSSFRPVGVFKGLNGNTHRVNLVRQILVTLQFAVLIGLMKLRCGGIETSILAMIFLPCPYTLRRYRR